MERTVKNQACGSFPFPAGLLASHHGVSPSLKVTGPPCSVPEVLSPSRHPTLCTKFYREGSRLSLPVRTTFCPDAARRCLPSQWRGDTPQSPSTHSPRPGSPPGCGAGLWLPSTLLLSEQGTRGRLSWKPGEREHSPEGRPAGEGATAPARSGRHGGDSPRRREKSLRPLPQHRAVWGTLLPSASPSASKERRRWLLFSPGLPTGETSWD